MQPHRQERRQTVHLHQEERHEDQEPGVEGVEGDAYHVSKKQEALQEEVSQKKPGRDRDIYGQEEVQLHALLEEEEGSEERAQAEGVDVQPIDHREAAGSS